METIIKKVWENKKIKQKLITIPKNSDIVEGDYVEVEKVKSRKENESENYFKKRLIKEGYAVIHKGYPDFIIWKDNFGGDIIKKSIVFVEIKREGQKLSEEQKLVKKILEKLGLKYKILIDKIERRKDIELNKLIGEMKDEEKII